MTPMELIRILDSGMVEELKMYYNGRKTVVNIRNIPETIPNYEINKLWNSEDGKGISILLVDNMELCGMSHGVHKTNFCPNCGADMRGGAE